MLYQMMNWGDWGGWMGNMMNWGALPFALSGVGLIVALLLVLFWLWMLVDCLGRRDVRFPTGGEHDKVAWVFVLLYLNILGAIIYYVMVKSRGGYMAREEEEEERPRGRAARRY